MPSIRLLWQTAGLATHDEQVNLGLRHDQCVARAARLRLDDQLAIVAYELTSVPIDRLPRTGALSAIYEVHELAALNFLVLGAAKESIATVVADSVVGRHLGISARQPVSRLDRTIATTAGIAIEWRVSFSVRR